MSEVITDRIIDDARAIVNSTLEEGNAKANEILEQARNDARIYKEKNMKETIALRDEIIRRRISVANLEVKKLILAAKKRILDAAFAEAEKNILALPKKEYLAIIEGMLTYAASGDEVHIAKRDKTVITAAFIESQAKKLGISLTLSHTYADIEGGIILSSGSMDKNLSIEVELNAVREDNEAQVAVRLFGEN